MSASLITKGLFVALLIATSFQLYFSADHWAFISGVNLIFHEAGHVLFAFFGQFIYVLGGTIGELMIPAVVAVHFYVKQQQFAFGFALWWLSTAFLSVGIYAADAKERQLPLITGDESTHDWLYLLLETNLIRYDDVIGGIFVGCSVLFLIFSLIIFTKYFKKSVKL